MTYPIADFYFQALLSQQETSLGFDRSSQHLEGNQPHSSDYVRISSQPLWLEESHSRKNHLVLCLMEFYIASRICTNPV